MRKAPSRRAGDILSIIVGLVGGVSLALAVPSVKDAIPAPGGWLTASSIVAAMVGTYLSLVVIFLAARIPWLEKEVGQDALITWHRKAGPLAVVLIAWHVLAVTVGYAVADEMSVFAQAWDLAVNYDWMLAAVAAALLMVVMAIVSWHPIRSRMKYETWHAGHLYFYLAIALAFGHQITNGTVFAENVAATVWWSVLYAGTFAAILTFRVGSPIIRSLRHDLRVHSVQRAEDDCVHVYMTGRDLAGLGTRGGQWFSFRFLNKYWRYQSHPYSISAAPNGKWLRVTVKDLGDQSGRLLQDLKPGTKVGIEGPYGAFTAERSESTEMVLIAAGVGITPMVSMVSALPRGMRATVIYRARTQDAPLLGELENVAGKNPNVKLVFLPGSRQKYPITAQTLTQWAPNITRSDLYVCGGTEFMEQCVEVGRELGLPDTRIHHELFDF